MAEAPQPTKTAIMDAAEHLMAEHGLDGVSIRAILTHAGANSAALHYHFGSRENLVEAVLARRGGPMNLHRRRMLDELEARDAAPAIADIVEAVVDPAVQMLRSEGEAGRSFIRFLARLQLDRASIHQELEDRYFPDIRSRIGRMLLAACAPMPPTEVNRRATLMLDAMLHSLATADVFGNTESAGDREAALTHHAESLKTFLVGGLTAPDAST